MKNIILSFLFLFSFNSYSQDSFSVNSIGNSCAPWDGHAIHFSFKNDNNPSETINISVWRWRSFLPSFQTTFDFNSKSSKNGSMNFCTVDNSKPTCKLLSGTLKLDKPFYSFKPGDVVSGYFSVDDFNYKKIIFNYIVKVQRQTICG